MVLPNLIHPVPVEVERFSTTNTYYDEDAREPIGRASRKESYTLPGQVAWGTHDEAIPTTLGAQDGESGYVLFRQKDMDRVGYTPKRLDRITRLGKLTGLKLYIDSVVPWGHYPDQGGHSLWRCNFVDRAPAEQP